MAVKTKKTDKKDPSEGLQKNSTVNNSPISWGYSSRQAALDNAAKAAAKRAGMKMVRVDAKTWKYV